MGLVPSAWLVWDSSSARQQTMLHQLSDHQTGDVLPSACQYPYQRTMQARRLFCCKVSCWLCRHLFALPCLLLQGPKAGQPGCRWEVRDAACYFSTQHCNTLSRVIGAACMLIQVHLAVNLGVVRLQVVLAGRGWSCKSTATARASSGVFILMSVEA